MMRLSVCLILLGISSTALAAKTNPHNPRIEILDEPAMSGRVRLAIDDQVGWWWPKPEAVDMLQALQAEQEYRLNLVPELEAKIEIQDWKISQCEKATEKATDAFAMHNTLRDQNLARISELEAALDKKRKAFLIGMGTGAGLVVLTAIAGVVAGIAL